MWLAEIIAAPMGSSRSALPWLMVPSLILVGMVLVTFVQPDPKEIGMHLERYYPDYVPPPKRSMADTPADFQRAQAVAPRPRRGSRSSRTAPAQGNMSIVMVLTSLVLAHHGHSLTAIAFSHMFHSIGHVRLHDADRLAGGPLRPRARDVSRASRSRWSGRSS